MHEDSSSFIPLSALEMFTIFNFGHCNWCIMVFHCGFDVHFSNEKCVFFIPVSSSLVMYLFESFAHFLTELLTEFICFFYYCFKSFKHTFRIQVLYEVDVLQIFSPNLWFVLSFLTISFKEHKFSMLKFLMIHHSHFLILYIMYLMVWLKYLCLRFILLQFRFTFKTMIYFELIFYVVLGMVPSFFLWFFCCCMFSSIMCWKTYSFFTELPLYLC